MKWYVIEVGRAVISVVLIVVFGAEAGPGYAVDVVVAVGAELNVFI